MKKFLIGLFMIIMTLAFIALGISFTIEKTITENIGEIVKEEVTNEIVDKVSKNTNVDKEEIKKEITKVVEENATIKKVLDESLDKAMDILNGKEMEDLDFSNELEELIDSSEGVLKEYGITITKEQKEELLEVVSSEEFNQEFQNTVKEVKEDMPENAKTAIDAFNFIRSTTFKSMLIVGIVVILICIALLKKSYYKWLGSLSKATIVTGIFYSAFVSLFVNFINNELASEHNITLSTVSMNYYGYILLGIGVVALIANIVLSKTIRQKEISNDSKQKM